jgi:pilus assembly protein Flp/PilA
MKHTSNTPPVACCKAMLISLFAGSPLIILENRMRSLTKSIVSFLKNEDGPTAVEYAVMLSLIIVVCIAAITTLGSNANQTFSFVGSNIQG